MQKRFKHVINSKCFIKLISRLKIKTICKESKRIETLTHSFVQKSAIYELQIRDTNHEFTLKIKSNKVEKEVLLEIPNPNNSEMQKKICTSE